MTDNTWIKIHSGLSRDPKHERAMGVRVWLFMWLVDHANWDDGIVYNYTDALCGEDMERSARTIEGRRQELEAAGYIECHSGFQCQHIRIMRWRNPRLVNPPQINIPDDLSSYAKLRTHSTQKHVPIPTGNHVPLPYDQSSSDSYSQGENENGNKDTNWIFEMYSEIFKETVSPGEYEALRDLAIFPRDQVIEVMKITRDKNAARRMRRKAPYMLAILQDWRANGKPTRKPAQEEGTPIKRKMIR